jgi:hypothetical protein
MGARRVRDGCHRERQQGSDHGALPGPDLEIQKRGGSCGREDRDQQGRHRRDSEAAEEDVARDRLRCHEQKSDQLNDRHAGREDEADERSQVSAERAVEHPEVPIRDKPMQDERTRRRADPRVVHVHWQQQALRRQGRRANGCDGRRDDELPQRRDGLKPRSGGHRLHDTGCRTLASRSVRRSDALLSSWHLHRRDRPSRTSMQIGKAPAPPTRSTGAVSRRATTGRSWRCGGCWHRTLTA